MEGKPKSFALREIHFVTFTLYKKWSSLGCEGHRLKGQQPYVLVKVHKSQRINQRMFHFDGAHWLGLEAV